MPMRDLSHKSLHRRLKAVIYGAEYLARPRVLPPNTHRLFDDIAQEAPHKRVGFRPWLAICTATTIAANSPMALTELFNVAIKHKLGKDQVATAEFMREVGLKCVSFLGFPRVVNGLIAFQDRLPRDVSAQLETKSSRHLSPDTLEPACRRGEHLWHSVNYPSDDSLFMKLGHAHPDLPVHLVQSHYGGLLANPPAETRGGLAPVGRFLTSIVAIACLRTQPGVEAQLIAHMYGLQRSLDDGSAASDDPPEEQKTLEALTSEKGLTWIMQVVDSIIDGVQEMEAPGTLRPGKKHNYKFRPSR